MIIHMRTTLIIDDDLVRRAKLRAAEWNRTLSDVVNDALRSSLSQPAAPPAPFSLITYGTPNQRISHEPADFAAAFEAEDRESLRR